ncbi:SDR family NAD(P)-dependent oxidoreductase [Myxococcaceae bacterium JPH2]|nr:SDR family NAD(P)-dependent oxidoreductase [Myxococcaceae bacterium JPH2]
MLTKIFVPRVNANDDTAVIVEWSVPPGTRVEEGTPIAVVETSKATLDVTATAAGYLYPEHAAGTEVAIGALMATVSDAPLSEDERRGLHRDVSASTAEFVKVTAKARKLIQEHGLSEADFPGTARIAVEDVERLLQQRSTAATPAPTQRPPRAPEEPAASLPPNLERLELTASKRHEVRAMALSSTRTERPPRAPEEPAASLPPNLERLELTASKRREVRALVSTSASVVPSEVVVPVDFRRLQRNLTRLSELHQYPLTVSDVVLHLCGQLLPRYPAFNGVFEAGHPHRYKSVNIGFVLNTGQGIEVPVVRDVDRLALLEVAKEVRACILKYTKGQLSSRDCSNGSFTLTDLSGEGVLQFRPVLNAMQSAILGIGMHRPSGQANLILAFDHRMADGLLAARFLNELRTALEGSAEPLPIEPPRQSERVLRGRSRAELLQAFKLDQINEDVLKAHLRRKKEVHGVPLSHRQAGFWVLQRMAPATTAYNASIGFTLEHLDIEKFEAACRLLLEEHPFLGSTFAEERGAPVQLTPAEPELAFSYEQAVLDGDAARERLRSVANRPFSLERGPLCRIHVCQSGARSWVLMCVHHALIDGYSTPPLLTSLFEKYARLVRGEVPRLLPPRADHAAFAAWERDLVDGPSGHEHRAFWLAELDGPLPHLELPTHRPRGRKPSVRGATVSRWLEPGRAAAVEQFSRSQNVSKPAIFLSAFATLLHHYTGLDDIIIGVPGRGRPPEFTDAIGCFMNMLPLRVRGIAARSFLGTSQRARSALLDGLYHGDYPFQAIVRELAKRQPLATPPVFQVACVYQDLPFARLEQELGIQLLDDLVQEGQYELSLEIVEKAGRYRLHLKYDAELFDATTLEQVMEDLLQLLDASLADPTRIPADGERRRFPIREPLAAPATVASPVQSASTPEQVGAVEAALLEIWRDVLRTSEIRTTDRFAEVGGSSALAVVVADRIATRFGCEVDVTTLFKCPTIAALTAHVLANAPASAPVAPVSRGQTPPARDDAGRATDKDERLAIIGMSCNLPGANNPREFWENLRHGRESATWFSPDALRAAGVSEATIQDPHYVPVQYSLRGKEHFDAGFFRIPAKNATLMDPQGRLLLMHAWKAIEDAGYVPEEIPDTAVYVATTNALYLSPVISAAEQRSNSEGLVSFMYAQAGTIPTTISYHLGLQGPSVFVGTNCSSSLVALHSAAQALRAGDARLALVGAASISSLRSSDIGYVFQEGMNFASDGHCRAFDANADGMVPGEGVGVVLLKRASDALADGDRIYAFVRATGINNDGAEKMGYHAPSVSGQSRLVEQVLARSGVTADTVTYVEAHGTGTKLGDPVEIKALTEAYRRDTDKTQYCGIGSVKPNIGHLDAAAGLAGLIKLSLCLSKAEIPPSIHYERPNPAIDFARTPFFVVTDHRPWPASPGPRRAAINSLGIGGTNAHAILEEHREVRGPSPTDTGPIPFPLSARTDERLRAYASELAAFLSGPDGSSLSPTDVAFTLQRGRKAMERRLVIFASDLVALRAALGEFARDGKGGAGCYVASTDAEGSRGWPELAQRWINGGAVDWSALPGSTKGRRVSLPTYPFEEKRYWVSEERSAAPVPPPRSDDAGETRVLAPRWCPIDLLPAPREETSGEVLVVGGTREQADALRRHHSGLRHLPSPEEALGSAGFPAHVVWITDAPRINDVTAEHTIARCHEILRGVFRFVRACLAARVASRPIHWTFVTTLGQAVSSGDEVDPCHAALHGLVGSLAKEHPEWRVRLLDVEPGFDFTTRAWMELPWSARGDALALRAGRWHELKLARVDGLERGGPPYKHGGVYVIVGGAGGIGELWSRWMIERYRAQLVWIGRREEDTELRARLDSLGRLGARPVYIRADATDRGQLEAAHRQIKSRFSEIHGVVHSAVGVFDQRISEVDEGRFQEILSVKVDVSVRLAQVFGSEKLDFALFFSSIAAFEKAGGLAGYAAGSCFKDAFAERLAAQWPCPVKVVDWGYWSVGTGAALAPQAKQRLVQGGIAPLEVEPGMGALQDLIAGPFNRLVVVRTNRTDALDGILAPGRLTVLPGPSVLPGVPQPSAADLKAHEQFAREFEGSLAANAELMQRLGELLGAILHEPGLRSRVSQLSPMYRRWYETALELVPSGPDTAPLAERWDRWDRSVEGVRTHPELPARAQLADACLRALPDILLGRRSATSVMFPNASMALVEGIYKHNRGADHYNAALADVVATYLARRLEVDPSTPLRIIEVGAGTGGTSEAILKRLEPMARHVGEYAYTDVSKAFLFHAERTYQPRYPYLRPRLFDITQAASTQSIELGTYDVLVAANVIHATPDIRATLRNLKTVLRNGGLVALNEISDRNLFAHITFGLLEGWWNAVDAPLRMPGSPGLTPDGWRQALAAEHFAGVTFPASPIHGLGQQLVIAQSDGVVQHGEVLTSAPKKTAPTPAPAAAAQGMRATATRYLRQLFADVLKVSIDEIAPSAGFDEQGLDSIIFSQINSRLAADFPGTSTNLFFEHRTIESLVEHLLTEHGDKAAERFSPSASSSTPVAPMAPAPMAPAPRPSVVASADDPIAIIGLSCRFPQADSIEAYWSHLEAGRACFQDVPAERWSLADFYEPDPERAVALARSYCRRGGFIDGFADFDPLFFNISPLDVRDMDPQERWVLTCCWEALEDAGYSPRTLRRHQGTTGVFVGVTKAGFNLHTHRGSTFANSRMPVTSFSSMANRVSYHLDLNGPSMAIDTMCSSSLTALHQACESLRRGSCQVAIVGTANLYLHPRTFTDLCLGRMLTPGDTIECFSATGRGFLPGEGAAAVVLKPLSAAMADGDRIEAVIRGTAVNHGGRTNGYTVPSLASQRDLLSEAIRRSGARSNEIQYVESAANGSALADANEFHALRAALGERRESSCLVGTVKPNIGHLEAASGLSQLFKVVMQLRHRKLAPTRLGPGGLNPALDWNSAGLELVTASRPWPAPSSGPRRAVVMSVGAGGSNAAVVVEEHVSSSPPASLETAGAHLVPLSARTTEQLRKIAERLASHLATTDVPMDAVAYTLATGRQPLRVRRAFVAQDRASAVRMLTLIAAGEEVPGLSSGDSKGHAETSQAELDAAVERRDLPALAQWWVQGHDTFDWARLYPHPRRCRLPAYPFEQRRFWYEPLPADAEASPGSSSRGPTQRVPDEVRASIVSELKSVLLLDGEVEIDAESTFQELGLDSLGVVKFMQALAQRLGLSLPETLVFDYPTLGALAGYIAERTTAVKRSAAPPAPARTPFEHHVAQVIGGHPEVVPLQLEGEGEILFCIHPMSGDVGLYQKIADASERRFRVLGIKARGWLANDEPLRSIEAMAAHYAGAIAAVQPEGPIHLFGASMGGTVAYEIVRALQSRGRRVGALFLAESPVVEDPEGAALWDSDARQNLIMNANFLMITLLHMDPEFRRRKAAGQLRWADLEIRADRVAEVPLEQLARHLVELVRHTGVRKEAEGLAATLRSMADIHLANLKALNRYRASPLSGADGLVAVLLRTQSAHACSPDVYNPDYLLSVQRARGSMAPFFQAWGRVLPGFETHLVPGANHFDLMNTEAASRAIANRIADHMLRAPAPRTVASTPDDLEGIAIIGMSGRFPDADDVSQFWRNIRDGLGSVRAAPSDRGWNIEDYYDPRPQTPRKTYARKGGFLSDVQSFDPLFFNLTPRDAALLDPSVRIFLQESWRAIEDAGYSAPASAGQPWGVFACAKGDYAYRIGQGDPTYMAPTDATAAGLLSYFLDLVGPSLTVDTACSSTLAAVAMACDSLSQGQCSVAIAGGGGIYTTPNMLISSSQSLLYSPDDTCYTFDERANGTVMGEAVASVVLKPLRQAMADGDRIHGVIRGWGINQDGKTHGFAAPSAKSQSQLQEQVYRRFRIHPETISLVEAHGTGTKLGDPIEVRALTQSFRQFTQARGYCALGSVKTNIGHAFFGAGVVALIKVLGALRHRQLPPTLNFETLNSQIELADSPFYVNTALRSWEVPAGTPRRAAINAFGATGTNVHLVVDEWPETSPAGRPERATEPLPIVLSAKTPESLQAAVQNLRSFLTEGREEASPRPRLEDVAFSLAGRTHLSERLAFMARDLSELERILGALTAGDVPQGCHRGRAKGSRPNRSPSASGGAGVEIAQAYVAGETIDWTQVFRGRSPTRIRLPTYAFAKERCWVDMPVSPASRTAEPSPRAETMCFERSWVPAGSSSTPGDVEQHALLCDFPGDFDVAAGASGPRLHVSRLSSSAVNPAEHFRDLAAQGLTQTQALLAGPREQPVLVQLVIRATPESELTAGVGALLQTAAQEDPRFRAQIVRVPSEASPAEVRAKLVEARAYATTQIRWRAGRAEGADWAPAKVAPPSVGTPFKEGGVYLITGGAGGIGRLVAQAVARSTRKVTLLLAGRSQPGPELQHILDGLSAPGVTLRYERCDVSHPGDVRRLVQLATQEHGGLHGVFHCAGVTRDSLVRNKRREDLDSVFAAKVSGVVALDEATRDLDLDFFILFSSGAGALGNVGQADYAMANAFLDGFAELRNQRVASGARAGHTLSVGWPLWKDGGMKLDASHEARLRSELGVVAMPAAEGIHALVELLRARVTYACVVHGYRAVVEARLATGMKTAPAPIAERESAPASATREKDLRGRVLDRVRSLVADVIQLDPARLDTEEPLDGYGIDSIVIGEIMNRLAAAFGGLPRTLFYEHQSLTAIAAHLASTRAEECITWTGGGIAEQVQERPAAPVRAPARARDDIAIIGVSARFPGGATPDELWRTLVDGACHIQTVPPERWSLDGFYEPSRDRALRTVKSYLKHGAFLEDFSSFDPLFFGISPSSARDIDPHERLMLMCCWHALEDSGYSRSTLRRKHAGNVGVFVGVTKSGFALHTHLTDDLESARLPLTSFGSFANRVSYSLDLQGPSLAVDTMCSSSLTALHEACEHIRRGDCEVAFAGAVNLYLHPRNFIDLCQMRMASGDGQVRCFSKDGDGFVPGEGVAAILLKPLEQALADGDSIRGVITGSALNHGGLTHGYSVPSLARQREVIDRALSRAGCAASEIDYVESAANGSSLGDALEVEALSQLFGHAGAQKPFLGSVKPNLGHLEAASGFSQLCKVLLQFEKGCIAPTLFNPEQLDPKLATKDAPLRLVDRPAPWKTSTSRPRTALITSFGAGGAYAAAVVREPPAAPAPDRAPRSELIVLSARTEEQLTQVMERLHDRLSRRDEALDAVAWTLQQGRDPLRYRAARVVDSTASLVSALASHLTGTPTFRIRDAQSAERRLDANLDTALAERDLETIAALWLEGADKIPWERLHPPSVRRCQLPGYPFDRRSFWYGEAKVEPRGAQPRREDASAPAVPAAPTAPVLPGADAMRRHLLAEIRSILMLRPEDPLDSRSTFLELGLDSITALRFMRRLSDSLGRDLRETLVFEHPTVEDLTRHLLAERALPASAREPAAPQPSGPRERLAEVIAEHPELVPLQLEGNGPLLFCIHPMSGDVGLYEKLAEASRNRFRMLGLRARGFLTDRGTLDSIPEIATYYVEIATKADPVGPYHLFGSSMGGTVAYEMARQLQERGKQVERLILVESPLVENNADGLLWDSDERHNWVMNANFLMISMLHFDPEFRRAKEEGRIRWSEIALTHDEVAGLDGLELVRQLVARIEQRGVKTGAEILRGRLVSMARTHLANLRALRRYRATPRSWAKPVQSLLVRTRSAAATSGHVYNPDYLVKVQQAKGSMEPFLAGWTRLLPGMRTAIVEGDNHFDLLGTRHVVQSVADQIASELGAGARTETPHVQPSRRPTDADARIAVIGMSARFPGAANIDDFWRLLERGECAVGEFPTNRGWDLDRLFGAEPGSYVRRGGFLQDIAGFDPGFFRITPKEAELLDPTERLFLQESWNAIEDAGVDPTAIGGQRWGVFCGAGGDYGLRLRELTGIAPQVTSSSIPGRVAYTLDLTGPVLALDAGCASSLVAVSHACEQLASGSCDVALAGGALVYSTPNLIVTACQARLFSPDGKSRVFDAGANGMVPGEAVAVLVLKPLRQALEDGDRVYGVIDGWGSNHNGKTNGMASPNGAAQRALYAGISERFGIDPSTVDLVEANANGSPVGDVIEVQSLNEAFAPLMKAGRECVLGSVEGNIGHAFQASGMGHLVKVLLSLHHQAIPPTVGMSAPHPSLRLAEGPFKVTTELRPWLPSPERPRRAAISSFGATGANAHLVLSEAPATATTTAPTLPALITLSAHAEEGVRRRSQDLLDWTRRQRGSIDLGRLSGTLLSRRGHFAHRAAFVCADAETLARRLADLAEGRPAEHLFRGHETAPASPALVRLGELTQPSLASGSSSREEDLLVLADLYCRGVMPKRGAVVAVPPLSLPGYPFAREAHWYGGEVRREPAQSRPRPPPPTRPLQDTLTALVSELTGYPPDSIDADLPLSAMGFDSLLSMRLQALIQERLRAELAPDVLMRAKTIRGLAEHLRAMELPVARTIAPGASPTLPSWLEERLAPAAPALQGMALPWLQPRDGAVEDMLASEIAEFLRGGSALARSDSQVFAVGPRAAGLASRLEGSPGLSIALPSRAIIAPASREQRRSLYHSEVLGRYALNLQHAFLVSGRPLDFELLERAFTQAASHHDILRTRYLRAGKDWVQVVSPEATLRPRRAPTETLEGFYRFLLERRSRLLDVSEGPPLELWVMERSPDFVVGVVAHHATADAFTAPLLLDEVLGDYDALLAGRALPERGPTEQYWQYALRQHDSGLDRSELDLAFWRRLLPGAGAAMRLPYAADAAELSPDELELGDGHLLELPASLGETIDAFSAAHGLSLTQIFAGALGLVLTEGLGNERAVLRLFNNQRDRAPLFRALGEFSNVLLLPIDPPTEGSTLEYLFGVRARLMDGLRHARVDLEALLPLAGIDGLRGYYQSPGDVVLDSADVDSGTKGAKSPGVRSLFVDALRAHEQHLAQGQALATWFIQVLRVDGRIHLFSVFRKRLFEPTRMRSVAELLVAIAGALCAPDHRSVGDLLQDFAEPLRVLRDQAARPPSARGRFPELVRLNERSEGRPVFWIHAGLGGVELYRGLAASIDRPFYGIQARGWMTDRAPLRGIEAMASYYVHVLTSVQPHGPYDLGGYSLGGMLAYEVVRQLQAMGEEVRSLVMLDTFDAETFQRLEFSERTAILQAANLALHASAGNRAAPLEECLVHRDALDAGLEPSAFLTRITELAKQRGMIQSPTQLRLLIQQMLKVQSTFEAGRYAMPPLPSAGTVRGYYVRNRSGRFYGDLSPYYLWRDEEASIDGRDSWTAWRERLPGLGLADVDAANHMTLLAQAEPHEVIRRLCAELYRTDIAVERLNRGP